MSDYEVIHPSKALTPVPNWKAWMRDPDASRAARPDRLRNGKADMKSPYDPTVAIIAGQILGHVVTASALKRLDRDGLLNDPEKLSVRRAVAFARAIVAETIRTEPNAISEYERGRLSVRRELTAEVRRFADDDSLGMGDLLNDVVDQFLLDEPTEPHKEPSDGDTP